jgi:hypothetical protein
MSAGFGSFGIVPGKPVVKSVSATSAGAGNTDCSLQPAAGEIWVVLWALGFHDDDAAGRNCQWRQTDGVTDCGVHTTAADAANVYRQLYDLGKYAAPIVVDENFKVYFRGVDLVAAHKVEVRALVHVIKGVSILE